MKTDTQNLYDLFEVAYNFMLASGGDGCSLIVCDNYAYIANHFENWIIKTKGSSIFIRDDDSLYEQAIFYYDQESVIFCKDLPLHYNNIYELIAILPPWYQEFLEQEEKSIIVNEDITGWVINKEEK